MANDSTFTEHEKAVILDALTLKSASVKRFINGQVDGSSMSKAGYDTLADIESVMMKVGKL